MYRLRFARARLCHLAAVVGVFVPAATNAQTNSAPVDSRAATHAVRTASAIEIDGRLDEQSWHTAPPAAGFQQIDPSHGEPSKFETEVRILYDDDYLYIGAFLRDSMGAAGARVQDLRRDFGYYTNDIFGVNLDGFGDGRFAMVFQTNSRAVQRDLLVTENQIFDIEWNGVWSVRTVESDSGWTAEIAIPWSTLRYAPGLRTWRVNFHRMVRRAQEESGWSPWRRGIWPYDMTYAGLLAGLEPPPPSTNVSLQPYAMARAESSTGVGDDAQLTSQIGADAKWAVNPSTVLDLTVNPDFGQADADRQVVNLERFSVFFPERRPFFLENAGLFSAGRGEGIQPFFSRRVGLDPGGQPVPITGGARLTHRTTERSLGAMAIRQEGYDSIASSIFGVGRYIQNVGEFGRIGGLVATRFDEGASTASSTASTVASADVFFRPTRSFTVSGMASQTFGSAGRDNGTAAFIWARNEAPWGYVGWIQEVVTSGYQPATGFVRRRNFIWTSPFSTLDLRPGWRPSGVRSFRPAVGMNLYHGPSDGAFQEGNLLLRPVNVLFENGSSFGLTASPTWQRLEQPFTPLAGISVDPGSYSYTRWQGFAATDPASRFGGRLDASTGGFYDGRLHALGMTGQATLSPRVALFANYSLNALRSLGVSGAGKTTHLVAPEVRLALNPRVQLTGFYQYNSAAELSSWNARFSWEFLPLSYLYLVYNDRQPIDTGSGLAEPAAPGERQFILKLTWLGQL